MDYLLNEAQHALRETVRTLVGSGTDPRMRDAADSGLELEPLRKTLAESGFLGIMNPVSCGGRECSVTETVVILEELALAAPLAALGLAEHNFLFVPHLRLFGDEAQKSKYLEGMSGLKLGSWCVLDPSSGAKPGPSGARAALQAERWVVNGAKASLTNGLLAERFVVTASTNSAGHPPRLSAFVLDRGLAGIGWRAEAALGRHRHSGPGRLVLTDVHVPADRLIGQIGGGLREALEIFEKSQVYWASLCLGITAAALEKCLAGFQMASPAPKNKLNLSDLKALLAERLVELETARLLTYRAAFDEDRNRRPGGASALACRTGGDMALRALALASRFAKPVSTVKRHPWAVAAEVVRRWLLIGQNLAGG